MTFQVADTIFTNGKILTLDKDNPIVEAIAVVEGRILACGKSIDIKALAGSKTRFVSLGGRFVMPGLIESHTHALWGACRDLFEVYVGYTATTTRLAAALQERAAVTPPGAWINGGPWRYQMRGDLGCSPRVWLDTIAPAHPVAIFDTSQHAVWCNSMALERVGLDETSADISGGILERAEDGRLTGFLAEAAIAPIRRALTLTQEQLAKACDYATSYLNSLGYIGFKEPMADEDTLATYAAAIDDGRWTIHCAAHITAFSPLSDGFVSLEELDRLRAKYARPDLRLDYAKLFLDGVAPAHTASFLEPYKPALGYDPTQHDPDATMLISKEDLAARVTELDRGGYVVKMHAVGDNAIRNGLDAIEAARGANGGSGLRHEIAHSAFVSDVDLHRFARLDAVAEVSPKLWMPNAATPSQQTVLSDEQMSRLHRIRDLIEAKAEVIFGTDWPASAPDANPWTGLAGMMSRRDPLGVYPGAINPDQAISFEQAIDLFTKNGARAMGMAGQTGIIAPGAWADFIVLDGDIRTMTPEQIGAIEVQETVWKGQTVFAR